MNKENFCFISNDKTMHLTKECLTFASISCFFPTTTPRLKILRVVVIQPSLLRETKILPIPPPSLSRSLARCSVSYLFGECQKGISQTMRKTRLIIEQRSNLS